MPVFINRTLVGLLLLTLLTQCDTPKSNDNEYFISKVEEAEELRIDRKFDKSTAIYDMLYNDAVAKNNKEEQAFCIQQKGLIFQNQVKYEESLDLYKQAYNLSSEIGDTSIMAAALLNRGIIYKHLGAHDKAIESLTEGAKYFESLLRKYPTDKDYLGDLASAYNSMGDLYANHGDTNTTRAFSSLFKALELRKKVGDSSDISRSYNFLGSLHMKLNRLDSAMYYFNIALEMKIKLDDKKLIASTLSNIGELKSKQGKYDEARKNYMAAYAYQDSLPDYDGLAHTTFLLAENFYNTQVYDKATVFLTKSNQIADSLDLMEVLLDDYSLWGRLYWQNKDYENSLKYMNMYIQLKDSIYANSKTRAFTDATIGYEVDQRVKENNRVLAKSERIRTLVIILSVFSLLLILLIYAVYRAYVIRKRGETNVKFLMRELNHRVKNNLQVLSSLLGLQTEQLRGTPAYEALRESENRVRAMALIHRKLYLTEQMTRVNMNEFITQLVNGLMDAFGYESENIELEIKIEQELLEVDKALPIGLIINELVSNSFKHAFRNVEQPFLRVNLEHTAQDHILLTIADNGPGLPEKATGKSTSFGLKLVEAQSRQLKASLQYRYHAGACFELNIPK